MKKFLSVTLCLAMMVSLVALVPFSASAITASEMSTKLNELRAANPNGKTNWGTGGSFNNGQAAECVGFAALCWQYVHGENWYSSSRDYAHRDINALCIGDHVRFRNGTSYDHSIFITNIVGDTISYVDANGSGVAYNAVQWDRTISRSELNNKINQLLTWPGGGYMSNDYGYIQHHPDNTVKSLVTTPAYPTPPSGWTDVTSSFLNKTIAIKSNSNDANSPKGYYVIEGSNGNTTIVSWPKDYKTYTNGQAMFQVVPTDTDDVGFKSKYNGKFLSAYPDGSQVKADGSSVWGGAECWERFRIYYKDGTYVIRAGINGKYLYADGINGQIKPNGAAPGGWEPVTFDVVPAYTASSTLADGYYAIQHKGSGNWVLSGGADENGKQLVLWEQTSPLHDNRRYFFERQSDGTYVITSKQSGMAITNGGNSIINTNPIYQTAWRDTPQQRWFVIDCGNGYYKFVSKGSGSCIDVTGNNGNNGTPIIQYLDTGGDAQRFTLVRQDFTITYNTNGGTGAPAAQTKWRDAPLTLSSTIPTRTGYTFLGWSTSNTATMATYSVGGNYSANANAALYAVWRVNEHSHNYGSWTITKAATETATGVRERSCTICGTKVTESIPKLPVPATALTLNSTAAATLGVGQTTTRTATITPANTTDKTISWTSSNTAVATVSGGKVTTVAAGTATITAQTSNDKTASFKVTIKPAPTKIAYKTTTAAIGAGQPYATGVTLTPSNAQTTRTYTSSNTKVATVDTNGKITGKAAGTATITVKTYNGKTATFKVTVKPAPTKIALSKAVTLGVGEKYQTSVTLTPTNAQTTRTYSSSNTKVATVDSTGKITAKAVGTAKITVKTYNGKTSTITVTVKAAPSKVTLSRTKATLYKGESLTLAASLPSGTASFAKTWTSSNTKVATVSGGKITAKGKGTATITVKLYNGKTASCKVTVK